MFGHDLSQREMHFLRLLGGGDFARPNRPNRFVSDHDFGHLLGRKARQRTGELALNHPQRFAGLAIGEQFADANDGRQPAANAA